MVAFLIVESPFDNLALYACAHYGESKNDIDPVHRIRLKGSRLVLTFRFWMFIRG